MSAGDALVVGLGEALFDVFDRRKRLGGAPLNVAVQAHQLIAERGGAGVVVSRVGDDELGGEIRAELTQRGMTDRYVQVDPERPTGTVRVTLRRGEPSYEIVRDVAWDALELDAATSELATRCAAVCYGTLAQRTERSRLAIQSFVEQAMGAIRLFDVNLRQDFYSAEVIRRSCELASIVKLNEGELPEVVRLLGLEQDAATTQGASDAQLDAQVGILREHFQIEAVALTRGARGTAWYTADGRTTGASVHYDRTSDADSVGAGDACSAGLIVGMLLGWPAPQIVALANHMGAFVASQSGATPQLPEKIRSLLAEGRS